MSARAAVLACRQAGWEPKVLHVHGWSSALLPGTRMPRSLRLHPKQPIVRNTNTKAGPTFSFMALAWVRGSYTRMKLSVVPVASRVPAGFIASA
jgi:hypothetical protein